MRRRTRSATGRASARSARDRRRSRARLRRSDGSVAVGAAPAGRRAQSLCGGAVPLRSRVRRTTAAHRPARPDRSLSRDGSGASWSCASRRAARQGRPTHRRAVRATESQGRAAIVHQYRLPRREARRRGPTARSRCRACSARARRSCSSTAPWRSPTPASSDCRPRVLERCASAYEDRVWAYDHHTISKTPAQNATDLIDRLRQLNSPHLVVDVIADSRGGLVARELAELQARGSLIEVRSVLFVATPNGGTPLCDPQHLQRLVDRYTNLFALVPDNPVTDIIDAVSSVAAAVALRVAGGLVGIAAMDPSGPYQKELSDRKPRRGVMYHAIASDFDPVVGSGLVDAVARSRDRPHLRRRRQRPDRPDRVGVQLAGPDPRRRRGPVRVLRSGVSTTAASGTGPSSRSASNSGSPSHRRSGRCRRPLPRGGGRDGGDRGRARGLRDR